ncbi:hypothetical protein DFAR_3690019 [Desulfarculales bacterium]
MGLWLILKMAPIQQRQYQINQ